MSSTTPPYDRSVTSARTRADVGRQVRPRPLATLAVAVVLGILGMHGFDAHGLTGMTGMVGVTGHHSHSTPAIAGATHTTHVDSPRAAVSMDEAAVEPGASVDTGGTGGTGGMDAMAMLCVAMLAGAAAGLLLLALRRRQTARLRLFLPRRGGTPALPARLRVGTGPPPVWSFSVIRC